MIFNGLKHIPLHNHLYSTNSFQIILKIRSPGFFAETFPTERKGRKFPADKTKMGREKQKRWKRETVI